MSFPHAQPETEGALSRENAPQVVVRAGKTFLCSACGTLVEVPPDVIGQLVVVPNPSPQAEPAQPRPTPAKPSSSKPAMTKRSPASPPRPRHPKRPERPDLTGTTIEGLHVPSGGQLHRALAWVSFHLKVLDRQGSELQHVQKSFKRRTKHRVPCSRPRGHASPKKPQQPPSVGPSSAPSQPHPDKPIAPGPDPTNKRGPP
ncbi:hypothetical protein AB1K70_22915 [Bremerella sp. JC770]|uniref:hypothetical protein n=1 Tax=Bremerella sp. JC770 TaxID=3232137 RepID=UPI003459DA32